MRSVLCLGGRTQRINPLRRRAHVDDFGLTLSALPAQLGDVRVWKVGATLHGTSILAGGSFHVAGPVMRDGANQGWCGGGGAAGHDF